ncbi:rCG48975 [Rattus norvegicus]|uniref:RCG48975 n=1 Tax=Rattus norvegicus TaxID=10116 RepID=A6IFZ7_RAT|nr:rCG48975 [Rattus norvegicus]
MKIALHQLYFQ